MEIIGTIFIGVFTSIIGTILINLCSSIILRRRQKLKYIETVKKANNEIIEILKPYISEKGLPKEEIILSIISSVSRKYEVNVNLVAHPRKPSSNTSSTGASIYDISGASELGNLCHRMIWVSRIKDDSLPPDIGKIKIEVVKDRPTQSGGQYCEAFYDKKTRRIYTNSEEKMRVYSWEKDFNVSYNPYVEDRLICNINYNTVEEPPL